MRKVIQVSLGILAGAWLGFWLYNRSHQDDPAPAAAVPEVSAATGGNNAASGMPAVFARRANRGPDGAEINPAAPAEEPAATDREPFAEVLNTILTSNDAITNKAQQLLDLLPTLPHSEQEEAARHFINLADDRQFLAATPLLFSDKSAPELVELLMGETLNRPETVKLPVCLAVARQPNHPHAEQAKTVLFLYSDEDFGDNWNSWERLVQAKLKEIQENTPTDGPN